MADKDRSVRTFCKTLVVPKTHPKATELRASLRLLREVLDKEGEVQLNKRQKEVLTNFFELAFEQPKVAKK
ncbi:MAG: hypothetical protein WCG97_00360 [bacterium]